jgi:hypothetical protein
MSPSPFPQFAAFDIGGTTPPSPVTAKLDTGTPRGAVFGQWMDLVGATQSGLLQITEGRNTCVNYNPALSQRLVYLDPAVSAGFTGEQLVSWSTAAGGRVLYSDIHFLQPTTALGAFPNECTTTALSAQGKSIVFQLFDQPTCVP